MKTSYEEALNRLYRLQKFGIKFGLSKTSNLLKTLGRPQSGQRYIHIGGTNGKGSTASFMSSILKESGLRVGLYSSPHLVRFTERFKINDQEIPTEKAVELIHELTQAFVADEPPTFFEATTALAIMYFAMEKTDIAIMEVGMGGRLDATNTISPMVSLITNISMEHKFFLGSRLEDIAREKGGIIKRGTDLVTGVTQPSLIRLYESMAKTKETNIWRVGKDTRYRLTDSGFHFYGKRHRLKRLKLGLKGNFQTRNAAVALTAIERLEDKGFRIASNDIRKGLENATWPGRMQVMKKNPYIIVDGAHNPVAMRALVSSIKSNYKYKRLIPVIGIMNDKEIGPILQAIVPMSNHVIYTRPVYPRAADPALLAANAGRFKKPGQVVQSLTKALDKAREMADPKDLILVTGSLFTVGEAMAYFDPEKWAQDVM